MGKLVTAAQMRALEAAAVADGVSERELMANAGLAAAQEAWMAVGALDGSEALVLCGPGNNGGDGLVAALHLHQWGAEVHIYLLRPRPAEDAEWAAVVEAGIGATTVAEDTDFAFLEQQLSGATIVLDALFGTGFAPRERPITGDAAEVLLRLRAAREATPPVQLIALDLPSGVDADTGYADPHTVAADTTVTFGYAKTGLFSMPGRRFAGEVIPVGIGIPAEAATRLPYEDLRLRDVRERMPARPDEGHKGTFGTVVVAAGSRRFPGAARLAAEAAARSGAGLVTLAAPEAIQPLLTALADATHEPLPSTDGTLDAEAARALLRALSGGRARSLLVGPGLDLTAASEAFVTHLLAGLDGVEGLAGVVLDADALNALAKRPGWHETLALPRILTPHPAEMARLCGSDTAAVQAARLDTACRYAKQTGSIVVLKGACTIVAHPDGRARLSEVATSALAHAGSGDVLGGLIAGFLAQGLDPFDAASAGVAVHAECGRQGAQSIGPASTLASDLLRLLPGVRRAVDRDGPGLQMLAMGSEERDARLMQRPEWYNRQNG
ncbi:MAG: NAD(P)H-hydrate dehydratase [Dehalococcoidia bacterium]